MTITSLQNMDHTREKCESRAGAEIGRDGWQDSPDGQGKEKTGFERNQRDAGGS